MRVDTHLRLQHHQLRTRTSLTLGMHHQLRPFKRAMINIVIKISNIILVKSVDRLIRALFSFLSCECTTSPIMHLGPWFCMDLGELCNNYCRPARNQRVKTLVNHWHICNAELSSVICSRFRVVSF